MVHFVTFDILSCSNVNMLIWLLILFVVFRQQLICSLRLTCILMESESCCHIRKKQGK